VTKKTKGSFIWRCIWYKYANNVSSIEVGAPMAPADAEAVLLHTDEI
jgi:hypothetical protein